MITLTNDYAIAAVRKNLDEQGLNDPSMFGESVDDIEMDSVIRKTIPEAIDAVNAVAPIGTLDRIESAYTEESVVDGVLSFHTDKPVLRIVNLKAADSNVAVADFVPEASAIGRMQLNKHVRGASDNPVLVMKNGTRKDFRYYTVGDLSVDGPQKAADYLYVYNLASLDYDYAKRYFKSRKAEVNLGGCSSVRFGNFYGRNLDWYYDNGVDFVVRTPAIHGRHAVTGVCGGLSSLTKDFVESGVYSDAYRLLPFFMQDGINDAGLFCNINVVNDDRGVTTPTIPELEKKDSICSVMLVRYILDNFATKEAAVEYLTNYVEVYAPQALKDKGYEVHFMIGDATGTWILEIVNNEIHVIEDYNQMTNFYLNGVEMGVQEYEGDYVYTPLDVLDGYYPTSEQPYGNSLDEHSTGLERWNTITRRFHDNFSKQDMRALMNSLLFTNAYKTGTDPFWFSDFVSMDPDINCDSSPEDELLQAAVSAGIEAYENRDRNNPVTWQTTHSCVYDLTTKKLYIVSQEDTDNEMEFDFEFVPVSASILEEMSYISFAEEADEYTVSDALLQPVLSQLTAMVLAIFGMNDKAQYFFNKATLQ